MTYILFFFFFFFFAPFFLWLCAGWYTLHCLRNRDYFIIFSTHIYIGSLCSCFACTQVYQSPLGLWPTAAIHNCICILQITFYHWNNPVENLSRYLNLEKSQLKNFAGTGDWTQVCNSQSCLWCIYCRIALMQTWNQKLVALEGR